MTESERAWRMGRGGLNPADLPPLETSEDAVRWLARLARAVATGELHPQPAGVAVAAVRAWLVAHAAGAGRPEGQDAGTERPYRDERLARLAKDTRRLADRSRRP